VCSEVNNEFDISFVVIIAGSIFVVMIFGYVACTSRAAKKAFRTLLKDAVVISVGVVSMSLNYATHLATFFNIILPNPEFQKFVYPVIGVLCVGGMSTLYGIYKSVVLIGEVTREVQEHKLERNHLIMSMTTKYAYSAWEGLVKKYPSFHPNPEDSPSYNEYNESPEAYPAWTKALKEWKRVFHILRRPYKTTIDKSEETNPKNLPPRLCDSIIGNIRKVWRERNILITAAILLILQGCPMFFITIGPIMTEAPAQDIRSWTFRANIVIGAMFIGTKAVQVADYFNIESDENRLLKELYVLCFTTYSKAFYRSKHGGNKDSQIRQNAPEQDFHHMDKQQYVAAMAGHSQEIDELTKNGSEKASGAPQESMVQSLPKVSISNIAAIAEVKGAPALARRDTNRSEIYQGSTINNLGEFDSDSSSQCSAISSSSDEENKYDYRPKIVALQSDVTPKGGVTPKNGVGVSDSSMPKNRMEVMGATTSDGSPRPSSQNRARRNRGLLSAQIQENDAFSSEPSNLNSDDNSSGDSTYHVGGKNHRRHEV